MSLEVGTRCWYPDKDQGWVGAEVVKNELSDGKYHLSLKLENPDSDVVSMEASEDELPLLRNPPILESTEDLTSLSYLNEPAVLHAIKKRYSQLNIYTYSGIVLIAANPFDRVDQLYSQDMIQAYAGKRRGEMEPHLFAIAEEAYRLMKNDKQNQTIVVSGESGAGKTVSAKYIMRYFASVEEEMSSNVGNIQHQTEMSETEEKILATNPIMEAFGNAKTTRNDNSSRFGKYLEILFDDHTSIIGAKLRTYLLERSRLVYQPTDERNYHIFYQMLSGLSQDTKESLSLTSPDDYFYLNQGGATEIVGVDDSQEFKITTDALSLVGFDETAQEHIFKILAALLHIGNVEIKKTRNDASLSSDEPNLMIACDLLGIDPFNFAKWITKKQIVTRSEKIVSNLNFNQAQVARDSVAKFIYSTLFDWLVENINNVLCNPAVTDQIKSFIGVLDIYGFEHFEKNSFEQFCINYANEKLQQEFNQHVFKLEQEEYVNEQIEWSFIEFNDNQPCIDLIENKIGILSLLDEESRLPAGSDESWTQKLYQTLDKPPMNTVFSKPRFGQTKFVVSHYAHDVAYDTDGFIEKNRDTVSDGLLEVLKATTNETLSKILDNLEQSAERLEEMKKKKEEEEQQLNKKPGPMGGRRTVQRKPTLGSMFKQSLIELMETINSTNVHYIRCIKPNNEKEAWKFDNLMVLSQLRACGVLETIRISCAGFPSRWTFNEFILRYYILLPAEEYATIFQQKETTKDDIINMCKKILDITVEDKAKYQIGNTKIFFKAGMLAYLEKKRSDKMHRSIVLIQKHVKSLHYRKNYLATMKSLKLLQTAIKASVVRQKVDHEFKTNAALLVQTAIRGSRIRHEFNNILRTIIVMQTKIKKQLRQKQMLVEHQHDAAVTIQSRIRSFVPRKIYQKNKKCTITIQSMIRRRNAMAQLQTLKSEAKSVKNLQEVSYKLENKVIELTENLAAKIKENKEMKSQIEKLMVDLEESVILKDTIEQEKKLHQDALNEKDAEYETKHKELDEQLVSATAQIEDHKQQMEQLTIQHNELRDSSAKNLEELEEAKKQLSDYQMQNTDLQNEVKTLKEEITRLQGSINLGTAIKTTTLPQAAAVPSSMNMTNGNRMVSDASGAPVLMKTVSTLSNDENSSSLAQINEELYRLLENTETLNVEITEGLLKGFKVPDSGVSIALSRRDVVYPARILIIVLSEMWRFGLTKQSENFLAQVLITIQKIVTTLKGSDLIPSGAFWLANVRELYSFVLFARQSILTEENFKNDMNVDEYNEYVSLVTELKEDFESLSYNIYNIWLKKLQKELQKKAIPAIVMSESLPGFSASESNSFLNKFFNSNDSYTMDDILTFFNSIYWCMRSFHIENEVFRSVVTTLLNYIDSICFNDLIMRRNFLSWKRGLQLNYNITRLEEWCKSHELPDGADCLKHLIQTSKLLQLRKYTIEDINILRGICSDLSPAQLQKLITQSHVADYESPIPEEILKYVADLVKQESAAVAAANTEGATDKSGLKNDIFLHTPNGPFDDPFVQIPTREFDQVEAYIPVWLNLPSTKRIVDLVAQNVNVIE
ncbi:similar to Saccharomyces cerevisiae YAL029C MYO4 One of two type V myosin motors (along with MYO2) involved in actin- based transport of cargos [Maudiozyma barnettii]|nr:similar to Saccharomyces cerevisiae YAL029C MYO4 One of two type V myosin motors (along with MYO2) involved in actin- based transport of cargos [Kazachstania barnettii]